MMIDKIIDLPAVKERLDGDRDFFNELVVILISDYQGYLQKMQSGLSTGQGKPVQEAAHALKSALGNLGSVRARAAAYALETAGKEGNLSGLEAKIGELEAAYQEFIGVAKRIESGELW